MNSCFQMTVAALYGAMLGAVFFASLRWTVHRGLRSSTPALWFSVSLLVRTGTVMAGFLWIAREDWQRLIASLLGFFCVRVLIQCVYRAPRSAQQPLIAKGTP
jgi:F1F0 ATPase subunit 2